MNKKFLTYLVFSLLFLIPIVQAGPIFDLFSRVVQTNTISNLYNNYQEFIEFLIYMVIFISLIIGVFKDRFEKKQTKAIAIALGTALSISLVNFMPGLIGKLGPIAFFVFVALFWFLIFASLKKGLESSIVSMALAYIFAFLTFVFLDHEKKVQAFLKGTEVGNFLLGSSTELFIIALFIALGALFWWLINKFKGISSPSEGAHTSAGGTRVTTPSTTVSTGGGNGSSFWKDRNWFGKKKSSHPDKVSKKLKNALKSDELEIDQIEDAIGLLKDLKKAEDKLSEEEKSRILSKLNDYMLRITQADPTESVEGLVNERLQEIVQLRRLLNPNSLKINDIPFSKVVSSLMDNRYIPTNTKNELRTLISEMGANDRKLSNYERTLSTFKRVYDTRGQQFRRLAEQITVNINTGQTQNLQRDLANLLVLKKHLAETDERISNLLNDPEFVYTIEDVKNIYGSPEEIEDRSQEHINIHNIIRSALRESYVNKFNSYLQGFIENFDGEKTYVNFLGWLASRNIGTREIENLFGVSLEDFETLFNSRMSRSNGAHETQAPPHLDQPQRFRPIERKDPQELFLIARNYGKNRNTEDINFNEFIKEVRLKTGIDDLQQILIVYNIDIDSLGRIFERATGVPPEEVHGFLHFKQQGLERPMEESGPVEELEGQNSQEQRLAAFLQIAEGYINIARRIIQQGVDSNQALMESYQGYVAEVKKRLPNSPKEEYNPIWLETMKKYNLKYRIGTTTRKTSDQQSRQDIADTLRQFLKEFKED